MIDLTKLTHEQAERFIHLQALVDRQRAEHSKIKAYRDYYKGDHPILLTARQKEFLGELLGDDAFTFCHNVVKSIVDTLRERLSVQGFTVNGAGAAVEGEETTPDGQLATTLWDWWTENRMDSKQIRLYRRAIRDGRSYVMVDYDQDKGRPRFTLHKVDDGNVGVSYHRDPSNPDVVLFANRYFYTYNPLSPGATGRLRKTTYLPDQIRKYIQDAGQPEGWRPIQDDGDPGWPIPWTDRRGEPLGVALIEFENPGGSEIEQVLGLQNGLNKSWLDLIAAADAAGFPILAAEYDELDEAPPPGLEEDDDLEGDDEFRVGPGRVLEIFGGRMNRIQPGDLQQLIDVIWTLTAAISGVSRTPQYYLRPVGGSEVPSGEALKQLESGLVKRAQERQLLFGQAWEDVFQMAMRINAAFGSGTRLNEQPTLATDWADPEVRNEATEATVAETHDRLEVPKDAVWARLGYTPEQIAGFKKQKRSERLQDVAAIAQGLNLQARRPGQGEQNGVDLNGRPLNNQNQ